MKTKLEMNTRSGIKLKLKYALNLLNCRKAVVDAVDANVLVAFFHAAVFCFFLHIYRSFFTHLLLFFPMGTHQVCIPRVHFS